MFYFKLVKEANRSKSISRVIFKGVASDGKEFRFQVVPNSANASGTELYLKLVELRKFLGSRVMKELEEWLPQDAICFGEYVTAFLVVMFISSIRKDSPELVTEEQFKLITEIYNFLDEYSSNNDNYIITNDINNEDIGLDRTYVVTKELLKLVNVTIKNESQDIEFITELFIDQDNIVSMSAEGLATFMSINMGMTLVTVPGRLVETLQHTLVRDDRVPLVETVDAFNRKLIDTDFANKRHLLRQVLDYTSEWKYFAIKSGNNYVINIGPS